MAGAVCSGRRQAPARAFDDTNDRDIPSRPVQGAVLKNVRTPSNPAKLSIDAYISPSELRGAHNFARAAQPIVSLELQPSPPPLRRDQQAASYPAPLHPSQLSETVPNTIAETDFLIETRLAESDPPFRPPSSWQNAEPSPSSERQWHWSERSTAAFLGFAAGVLIIVPLVFFLSMTSDQHLPKPAPEVADTSVAVTLTPAKPVMAASVSASSWFNSQSTEAPDPVSEDRNAQASTKEAEDRARAALAAGRIVEARAVLRIAASPDAPRLWFVLAETYDPLVSPKLTEAGLKLAAQPGTSDQLTAADIKFARFYYQQALTHGVGAARERLAALAKP